MGLFQSKNDDSQREAQLRQERENRKLQLWMREQELELERQEFRRQQEFKRQQENLNSWGCLEERLSNIQIREEPAHRGFIEKIERDPQLIDILLYSVGQSEWADEVYYSGSVYLLETLETDSYESILQRNLFRKTNKPCFSVTNVQKMINPYLFLQFKLKEQQYRNRKGFVQIKKMYHGTKSTNVSGICETNFDWRRNGVSTGHKFGQGVSFSPYSNYATHYGDKKSFRKVMFTVDILVGESTLGEGNTVIPQGSADTTVNEKGSVYVKYEDNSFYPTYLITYEGFERRN